jgi:hypothetical protein
LRKHTSALIHLFIHISTSIAIHHPILKGAGKITTVAIFQEIIQRYQLRSQVDADEQSYALGFKEVWEVSPCTTPWVQGSVGGEPLHHALGSRKCGR